MASWEVRKPIETRTDIVDGFLDLVFNGGGWS